LGGIEEKKKAEKGGYRIHSALPAKINVSGNLRLH